MSVKSVHATAKIENDVIAVDGVDFYGRGIGQCRRFLVFERVFDADNGAIGDGENLRTISCVRVNVRRVSVDEFSVLVELHPVNRETLGTVEAAVAGDAARAVNADFATTVDRDPAWTAERRTDVR